MTWNFPELFIGPVSGLAISLWFGFQFLRRFEKTTERLLQTFEEELKSCNRRYEMVFAELMKMKDRML